MKLLSLLKNVKVIALDTAPFIYFIEENPTRINSLFLKVIAAAAALILFTASAPAAFAAPADQPMPYTVDPTRKVREACNLDSICNEWAMHDLKNAYTAAIVSSLNDPDVKVTAELLTKTATNRPMGCDSKGRGRDHSK